MKVEWIDRKTVKIFVESEKDLYTLYKIINKGDIIEAYDYRVLKFENEKEKRRIRLRVEAEDVKFSQYSDSLRISGRVLESSEEIEGHYHTLDIRKGSEILLIKEFREYEIKELEKSQKREKEIYIVSLDSHDIAVAVVSKDLEVLYEKSFDVNKEDPERDSKILKIYSEVLNILKNKNVKFLVICGPLFYPDKFYEYIKDKISLEKVLTFKVSQGGINGIYELLRRKEYLDTLKEVEIFLVNRIIEDFIESLYKGYGVLGLESVKENAIINNIQYIIVSENFFKKIKEEGKISELLDLFSIIERSKGDIYFAYEKNHYFDLIDRYGIVGKLRFKS